MMRLLAPVAAGLILSGCASTHWPKPQDLSGDASARPATVAAAPQTPGPAVAASAPPAAEPVPSCRAKIKPAAPYPDRDVALKNAASIYEQVQLLLAGRKLRMAREAELEAALASCSR